MILAKLKPRNQLTLPKEIVARLNLKADDFFQLNVENDYIKLTPVDIEPRYAPEELEAIDRLVEKEKGMAKTIKIGEEFSKYIQRITDESS